jgi:hypothetical protein
MFLLRLLIGGGYEAGPALALTLTHPTPLAAVLRRNRYRPIESVEIIMIIA